MIPIRVSVHSKAPPITTYALIALNIVIFLYEWLLDDHVLQTLYNGWGVVASKLLPIELSASYLLHQVPTLVSHLFLHAGLLHLLGNLWFLHVFGGAVEGRVGHVRFLLLYLSSGIAAAIAQVASAPHAIIPVIGASGAVSGIMGAYMMSFKKGRVLTAVPLLIIFKLIWLPSWIYLGFWIAIQILLAIFADRQNTTIAFWAHVGGFIAGAVLINLLPHRHKRIRIKRKKR